MKNRISFGDDLRSVERDPIGAVVCRYQVEFDSRLIEHSSVQEVRRGRFAAFAIDRSSGVAKARGPGNVSIWRRGQGKRAGLGPLAVAGANQSMRTRDTNWDYTRIDFADEMVGSERLRATTFQGEVQVVYGPVTEPLETLNLDHLPKDAAIMSCDSLQLVQRSANDGKKPIELTANGNAWLEGRSFSAYADTISYDESQGLYMLRSLGDRDAMLSRESRPGAERIPIIAKTFRFIPSRNYVDVDNASLAEGLQ